MNLDETQRKKVVAWIAEGLKLSEIQNRIAAELGIRMTYIDVRFLVDDLKLTPKDVDRPKPAVPTLANALADPAVGAPPTHSLASPDSTQPPSAAATGSVSVSVDQVARPNAVVSGKVTFSDGNRADWHLDQTGRLGLITEQPGYRPVAADLQQFQQALETELSKMGF
jgi:hypothetical protein